MSRSASVKRLMKEYADLQKDLSPEFTAAPLNDDMFEWHFTVRGPSEGGFAGGRYHGRLLFPADYPFKPPNIVFLTPNGRFETNKKICLSITGYHPEYWRPAWGVRSALIALISFFTTEGNGAIGALDFSVEDRADLAKLSRNWKCKECGTNNGVALPDESDVATTKLLSELQINFTSPASKTGSVDSVAASAESMDAANKESSDLFFEQPIEGLRHRHHAADSSFETQAMVTPATHPASSSSSSPNTTTTTTTPAAPTTTTNTTTTAITANHHNQINDNNSLVIRKRQIDTVIVALLFIIAYMFIRFTSHVLAL